MKRIFSFLLSFTLLAFAFQSCEKDDETNEVPEVTILTPSSNQEFVENEEVIFTCTTSDEEDGIIADQFIIWKSDKDGAIGSGDSLVYTELSVNTHSIIVEVTDTDGNTTSDSVIIIIIGSNNSPVITINNPDDNAEFETGESITFSCTASDVEDGVIGDDRIVWTSDIDGELGKGISVSLNNLTFGEHLIVATVTDSDGNIATDSKTIIIIEPLMVNLKEMIEWMTGSFSSENQSLTSSDPYHYDVRRKAVRFWDEETNGFWVYLEQAMAGYETEPYFQRVYHFFVEDGKIIDIIYKLNDEDSFVGAWETPEDFDDITTADMTEREFCGLAFDINEDHYYGTTSGKDCVSTITGVTYMTSEQWIYEDKWNSYDLGWNAADQVVMGPYSPYVFDKLEDFPIE